jgi:hypothetical protein
MSKRSSKPKETWTGQRILDGVPTERPADVVEATVLGKIRAVLEKMPDVHVMRNSVGAVRSGSRWIKYGLARGSSDLVAIVAPHGRWLCIEVKRPKGSRYEKDQLQWLENMRAMGAVAGVCTTVEQAVALVAEARKARVA